MLRTSPDVGPTLGEERSRYGTSQLVATATEAGIQRFPGAYSTLTTRGWPQGDVLMAVRR